MPVSQKSRSHKNHAAARKTHAEKPYRPHKKTLAKDDYCSKTEYWKDGNIWVVKKNYK